MPRFSCAHVSRPAAAILGRADCCRPRTSRERSMQHPFTRRDVLRGMAALAAAATAGQASAVEPGLRAIAGRKGIGFGAAVDGRMLKDQAYAAQLLRECNLVVPRNALKW